MRFCRNCGTSLAPGAPAVAPFGVAAAPASVAPPAMPPPAMPLPAMPAPASIAPPAMPPPAMPLPAAPVPASAAALPITVPAPAGTVTCPRCATATPAGFAYCQQCGFHVPSAAAGIAATMAAPATEPRPRPPSRPGEPRAVSSSPTIGPAVGRPGAAWGEAILVNRDGSDGQRFALASDDLVIGRGGVDIAFDEDRFLAREHARLSRAGGEVQIHPLDAVNGVFKKADAPVELSDGAVILVGREVLRFERVASEERAVHPLVRHGVALFGSPPREPWGRILQLVPSGGFRDVRHLAGDEVVLGREEGELVFRDDAFMSRRHAAITWNGQRAQLCDLGSSNGTFVRIAGPTRLEHGNHVRLGDQLLRIELR